MWPSHNTGLSVEGGTHLCSSFVFLLAQGITFLYVSVQFSCSVMSNSLRPPESQHARPPCPSSTPRVHSNSCPWSRWCHSAISSSLIPLSSCPQSLRASGSFPMSPLFAWGGQSIGISASASVLLCLTLSQIGNASVSPGELGKRKKPDWIIPMVQVPPHLDGNCE